MRRALASFAFVLLFATIVLAQSPGTVYLPSVVSALPTGTPAPTETSRPLAGWQTVFQDSFEDEFPGSWYVEDQNGPASGEYWPWRKDCKRTAGQGSVWLVAGGIDGQRMPCGFNYPPNAIAVMFYGPFSLVGAAQANLSVKVFLQTVNSADGVCLLAYSRSSTTRPGGVCYWGYAESGQWVDALLDLRTVPNYGSLLGKSDVMIGIGFVSDALNSAPNGGHIDDVVISRLNPGLTGIEVVEPSLPEGGGRVEYTNQFNGLKMP